MRFLLVLLSFTLFGFTCKPPSYKDQREFAKGQIAQSCTNGGSCPVPAPVKALRADPDMPWQELRDSFQSHLDRIEDFGDLQIPVPGGAAAVVWEGELRFAEGFGSKDRETHEAFQKDTLITSGSLTKLVTALTALILVEQGKLHLDTPIAAELKTSAFPFKRRNEDQVAADSITLRQLLTHTAGLPDELPSGIEEYGTSVCTSGGTAFTDYFRLHGEDPLWSKPGAVWNYSNPSYMLVAAAIEAVTQERFEAVAQRLVLEPAGMQSASFEAETAEAGNFAYGYEYWAPQGQPPKLTRYQPRSTPCRIFQPAAGLKASVLDYAKLLQEVMRPDSRLASKSTRQLLLKAQVPTHDEAWDYSFGLFVDQHYKGLALYAHDAVAWGYKALMVFVPEKQFALVLMQNGGQTFSEPLWDLALKTTDRFLGLPSGPRNAYEKPELSSELSGTYEAWTYDDEKFTEAAPAYQKVNFRIEKLPEDSLWTWKEELWGTGQLREESYPLFSVTRPHAGPLALRLVRASDRDLYLVNRSFVAKRLREL